MDVPTSVGDVVIVNPPAEPASEPAQPPEPAIVVAPEPSEVEVRLREIEGRQNLQEAELAELRQMVASKAAGDHEHPVPSNLQDLSDTLDAMDTEDVAPARPVPWHKRKVFA